MSLPRIFLILPCLVTIMIGSIVTPAQAGPLPFPGWRVPRQASGMIARPRPRPHPGEYDYYYNGVSKPRPGTAAARALTQRQLREFDRIAADIIEREYGKYMRHARYDGARRRALGVGGPTAEGPPRDIIERNIAERIRALASPGLELTWGKKLQSQVGEYLAKKASRGAGRWTASDRVFERVRQKLGKGPLAEAYFSGRESVLEQAFSRRFGKNSYVAFVDAMKRGDMKGAGRIVGLLE